MRVLCFLALASVALCFPLDTDSTELIKSESWFSLMSWGKKDKTTICEDLDWRKVSFKKAMELPAAGLFTDLHGTAKWETSGMDVKDDEIYMIFDSLAYIGKTDQMMQYRDPNNVLITHPGEAESDFEAIQYSHDTDTWLIVREAVPTDEDETWAPYVVEAKINDDNTYDIVRECPADYTFDNSNKGWEGGLYFSKDGHRFFLGLCEGNHCEGGDKGKDKGNGMAILTKLKLDDDGKCLWEFVQEVPIPKEAEFQDYSDLAIYGENLAVVSQEESAVWIGKLDTELWEITGPGVVYNFPRDPHCEMIYCNIEGIVFLDEYRLMTSSDKAKSSQPYGCVDKDQSVQVFYLPSPLGNTTAVSGSNRGKPAVGRKAPVTV